MNKVGRPEIYTQELAEKVCKKLAEGNSLRSVCREEEMPGLTTIFKWLGENEQFAKQYAQACDERTEAHNEILLELGDEAIALSQSVNEKASNAVVSAVKLKADNLKWVMSKQKPKKYGDKIDHTTDGKPITVSIINYGDKTTPQVDS